MTMLAQYGKPISPGFVAPLTLVTPLLLCSMPVSPAACLRPAPPLLTCTSLARDEAAINNYHPACAFASWVAEVMPRHSFPLLVAAGDGSAPPFDPVALTWTSATACLLGRFALHLVEPLFKLVIAPVHYLSQQFPWAAILAAPFA